MPSTKFAHADSVTALRNSSQNIVLRDVGKTQYFSYPEQAEWHTIPQGVGVFDVDKNGVSEIYFSFKAMPNFPDVPNVVFSVEDGKLADVTNAVFGDDVPTSNAGTHIHFSDLNADGHEDLVYSEAGSDIAPWNKTTAIEVLLNTGSSFRRITGEIEEKISGIRSYASVVGNVDDDEFGEIVLSSGLNAGKSLVLEFDAEGKVSFKKNPFLRNPKQFWNDFNNATNFVVADFDNDGRGDIFVGGNWVSPTNSILWSGLRSKGPSHLPETFLGWTKWGSVKRATGGDVTSTVSADFDNDGDIDLISAVETVKATWRNGTYDVDYSNGSILQILEQVGPRKFQDATESTGNDLGLNYVLPMIVHDLNSDGLLDVVVNYWMKEFWIEEKNWVTHNLYGSMLLMNQGGMKFQLKRALDIPGYDEGIEGMVFPVSTSGKETTVMILQPKSGGTDRNAGQRSIVGYVAKLEIQ